MAATIVPINNDVSSSDAMTIEEWTNEGGITLMPGESVEVKGRTVYKVSRARNGYGIFCNCSAWKFQKLHPLRRSCKHCEAVCGKDNEQLRVATATVYLLSKPATPYTETKPNPSRAKYFTKKTQTAACAAC